MHLKLGPHEKEVITPENQQRPRRLTRKRSLTNICSLNLNEIKQVFTPGSEDLVAMNILKRMRKYQLISSTKPFEGRIIPGIAPCLNYRIIKLDKETK